MLKYALSIILLSVLTHLFGQQTEQIFLDKNDSSSNCYTIIYPPQLPYKGYIVIIPGFGETAESVLQQSALPKATAQNGLLTIIPTLQNGVLSFGIDDLSQQSLELIIQHLINRHQLFDHKFFIGGFSIGGSCAIKYAQNCSIAPTAVFAIDPPLDFERFYNASLRDLRLSIDKAPKQENVYMVERISQEFNGTPSTALGNYHQISPYSFSDTSQAALKKFGHIPLRLYSEPDILWWLKERNADLTGMNVIDCSAMINELNRLGNHKAELLITENKGFRKPDNQRHPHSWSIVDNYELIEWMLEQD